MVKETCKNTKLSSLIFSNDLKDIDEKVKTSDITQQLTIVFLENYCKQQNLGFTDHSNLKKSDLNYRGLHLQECDSNKSVKSFLDYFY